MVDAIFFDMDGVLVDFNGGQKRLLGIEPISQEKKKSEDDDRLFALMREYGHFYRDLEPIEGSLELFRKVREKYGDKCSILTGIPKESRGIITAEEDKRDWVKRYIGSDITVHTVLRKEKVKFVNGKGSILIDDFSKNIREWEENGGKGILFLSPERTEEILRKEGIL